MAACTRCGREAEPDAGFCAGCGAPLSAESAREERKVVTVLFADLVGFTSRAEALDPEDVRALLSPYYARLRLELERFGGTVEKFIGDAVMALFGAPVAHEDDPERAVRAALAIRDWVAEEGDLHVRIAVNTGEALISLGARPSEGEGMASGDVVNTAARLQSAAPVDGILVGEHTYRATRDAIDYREAAPVEAKGKAEPIPVWQPQQARSSFGVDVVQRTRGPLVGRERELDLLLDALDRTRSELTPQLVTLVGVPGIGKSRLVYELFGAVDAKPDPHFWRQGRCLPYGQGVSLWALGEMVKAHAGILEDDGREQTADKLARAVRAAVPATEADWIEAHLRDLVGLAAERDAVAERHDEAFAAWRRFLEGVAESAPLILVFEDLHWADDALLDFVDHLVEWAAGVAILVVCLARPELLERRPGWGGGKLNALTLALSPLADEDAARVIAGVLEQAVLPVETQQILLERAGGNPLFAEQYARLFLERGSAENLTLPETVQGIIAARIDGLPAGEKAVLQDAAVFGKVFWAGALGDHPGLDALLHSLARKEFVRRERRPSIAGENELVFRHVLVRDVAYAQIPRAARARKHERAADWIESLGREDHAELVAHHCVQAYELARASGRAHDALAARAAATARVAGERASSLSAFSAAAGFFETAVALTAADDSARPRLLLSLGEARFAGGRGDTDVLLEAADALLAQGDRDGAADAERLLSRRAWHEGHTDVSRSHLERALELVGDGPPSRAKAAVLAAVARAASVSGRRKEALQVGREALALTEQLGLDSIRAAALATVGLARTSEGDWGGIDDLERALELAKAINSPGLEINIANNLGAACFRKGEVGRARVLYTESLRASERIGDRAGSRWSTALLIEHSGSAGAWDEALAAAGEFLRECEHSPHYLEPKVRTVRARIAMARGDFETALADTEQALALGREAKDAQVLHPCLFEHALAFFQAGLRQEARALVDELLDDLDSEGAGNVENCAELPWLLRELGTTRGAAVLLDGFRTPWLEALEAGFAGDWLRAAENYVALECREHEAFARLRAAETLVAQGKRAEADAQLAKALAFYRSVGATRYIREGEALLAATA